MGLVFHARSLLENRAMSPRARYFVTRVTYLSQREGEIDPQGRLGRNQCNPMKCNALEHWRDPSDVHGELLTN